MKTKIKVLLLLSISLFSVISVESIRDAFCFDVKNAYAANITYEYIYRNGVEVLVSTSQRNQSRTLSMDQLCSTYGMNSETLRSNLGLSYSDIANSYVVEVWCSNVSDPNIFCVRDDVGTRIVTSNGNSYMLPIVPELMDY